MKQLSPTEALRLRKKQLEAQAEAVSNTLESKFDYLHKNLMPLLGSSVLDSVVSKMPPFAQNFINKQESSNGKRIWMSSVLSGIASGAVDVAPFLLKGKSGFVISFLLQQAKNLFLKRIK
ncbi:hypothetical protein FACS1894145_7770 [Bacteroidia bacterium]|nr:hypothetical protein FACS1894145_7770 [Bacteroidia bacterium]